MQKPLIMENKDKRQNYKNTQRTNQERVHGK
jgi:hypothetical protein